jgi:hypothetical protein
MAQLRCERGAATLHYGCIMAALRLRRAHVALQRCRVSVRCGSGVSETVAIM